MSNWTPPTPDDVRALREELNLSRTQFAALADVSIRQVERYEAAEDTLSHRSPSFHVWELVMIRTGRKSVNPRKIMKEIRA